LRDQGFGYAYFRKLGNVMVLATGHPATDAIRLPTNSCARTILLGLLRGRARCGILVLITDGGQLIELIIWSLSAAGHFGAQSLTQSRLMSYQSSAMRVADHVTGPESDPTNCQTDSNLRITALGSGRAIHCLGKSCSNRRHGTGYD
jgi:hypothetical protein